MNPTQMTNGSSRQQLIEAAAGALAQLPDDDVLGMAAQQTGNFVQCARRIYKALGYHFNDNDIREIHYLLRKRAVVLLSKGTVIGRG